MLKSKLSSRAFLENMVTAVQWEGEFKCVPDQRHRRASLQPRRRSGPTGQAICFATEVETGHSRCNVGAAPLPKPPLQELFLLSSATEDTHGQMMIFKLRLKFKRWLKLTVGVVSLFNFIFIHLEKLGGEGQSRWPLEPLALL